VKNPWDRRKDESPEAFEAFVMYRDMGSGRSTAKVGKRLKKNKSLMDRWSSKHDWVDRTAAWEEHLDRRVQKEAGQEHVEMNRRHRQIAKLLQSRVIEAVQNLDEKAIAKMKPGDLARWFDVAVKVERLSAGKGDLSLLDELDLSKLDDKELERYEEIIEKATVE
jgi:hypothetical protein